MLFKQSIMNNHLSTTGKIALALGKGIIAGLAGTAAITLSQAIEMKLSKREPSKAPADVASKVLDVEAATEEDEEQFAQEVHWSYGTAWGIARGVLDLAGITGPAATLLHWGAVWGTAMILLPSMDEAPPVDQWSAGEIAKDGFHHLVYALAAGLVYDAID